MENITFTAREFPKPVLTVIKKRIVHGGWAMADAMFM